MPPTLNTKQHYERLAEQGDGWNDPPVLLAYMARWDGHAFFDLLGDVAGLDVLEVGIGSGRLAHQVLEQGCCSLTGIDISPTSLEKTGQQLAHYDNLHLIEADISTFIQPSSFDVIYSVLTMMHVEDKTTALRSMVTSLHPGGRIVLSIADVEDTLDYGAWQVKLHPLPETAYADMLRSLGCAVTQVPLTDGETRVATLIKAVVTDGAD